MLRARLGISNLKLVDSHSSRQISRADTAEGKAAIKIFGPVSA